MSYIALYRAWRPQRFSEVIGQIHISKTLKNALLNNRIAHAYLFSGPRGTGKTSTAKVLAKALNCLDLVDGEPCNQCENCLGINEGNFMDVFEIDAASNRGIDEIRDIRDKVKFAPSQGKNKVYIIDEVHMLTTEAFNALLKTLEEPPGQVVFVLATTEPHKVPPTIHSRCQRFDFRKISDQEIRKHLGEIALKIDAKISPEALEIIARKANGAMRDGISILDQCIAFAGQDINISHVETVLGILAEDQIYEMSSGLLKGDLNHVLTRLNDFVQSGKDIKQIINDLIEFYRHFLLFKVSQNEDLLIGSREMKDKLKGDNKKISLGYLGRIVSRLTEVEREMRFSSQPQVLLEAALVEIALVNHQGAPVEAVEKVEAPLMVEKKEPVLKDKNITNSPEETGFKDLDFQGIRRKWPEILEEVKNEKITIHACLIPAIPLGIKDGYLELSFEARYNFHRDKFLEVTNKELLESIIAKVTGMQVKLRIISQEREEDPQQNGSPFLQKALDLFGGDIVEAKD